MTTTIGEWWMWVGFFIFIASMLAIDLFLLGGKKAHQISTKEALAWTITWISFALFANFLLWLYLLETSTSQIANLKALEFFTGYLIEKSLSLDNIFVILMIFNHFSIPQKYQRRVLIYGVLGAIVMRLILILLGIWLIQTFHWVFYIFGVLILQTGIRMIIIKDKKPMLANNSLIHWMRRHLPVTTRLHGEKFFIVQDKLLYMTPLFLVLILIEISDLIFAVDSIPAIFAITADPFIVFTSNIFALLGLRALYFLVANMYANFSLLRYGLAFILIFIGSKMLLAAWIDIPVLFTLSVVVLILIFCIFLSTCKRYKS